MRRGLSASLALATLAAGCGFQPLYSNRLDRSASLPSVYVDIIPNRTGQMLREALQARLEGSSTGVAKQFTLTVAYSDTVQALGVQPDNSSTRNRDVGLAVWSLRSAANSAVQVSGGTVRSLDGYNIIDEQFFYATLSEEAAERRLASALADQIVQGVAVYFRSHPVQG